MLRKSTQKTALERLRPGRFMDMQRQQIEQFLGIDGGKFIDHAVFPGSLHSMGELGGFILEGRQRIRQGPASIIQQAFEMPLGPFCQVWQSGFSGDAQAQPIKRGAGLRNLRNWLGREIGQLLFQQID